MKIFRGLIFLSLLLFTNLSDAAELFMYSNQEAPALKGSETFRFWVNDYPIVGAELGPKDGIPVLIIGGYTTTFPYLKKLVEAFVTKKYHVFVYNPPGQGNGDLASWADAPENWQGIDGMLRVLPKLRHYIFEKTKKPMVIVGHSLGGLQARVGSLGIEYNVRFQPVYSRDAAERAKAETLLIAPVLSLPLRGPNVWRAATLMRVIRMTKIAPFVAHCISELNCAKPELMQKMDGHSLAVYLRFFQNSLSRGIFGVEDLDRETLDQVARYLLPQKVSKQILSDLMRWIATHKIDTINGFNLSEQFSKSREEKDRIPLFYVVGTKDSLTPQEPIIEEARLDQRATLLKLPIGHMGLSLSESAASKVVAGIDKILSESCDSALRKVN